MKSSKTFASLVLTGLLTLSGAASSQNLRPPLTVQQDHWAAHTVVYQIFVRSFQDSDGDGTGDLKGITSRLEYLKSLGVGALWLMPIYPSPSYHGYDVTEQQDVNPDYGTLADFDALVAAAHRLGLRVVLDWVPNHTSSQHPWFQQALNPASSFRDWYIWRKDNPGWTQPWSGEGQTWHKKGDAYYYGVFWSEMPDLNWKNAAVQKAMSEAARFWLNRGIDGFRVDASRHLIESDTDNAPDSLENLEWVRTFTRQVKAVRPDALVLTEAWTSVANVAKYFLDGEGEDMGFNFDLQVALLEGIKTGNAAPIEQVLDQVTLHYPSGALDGIFISNHDLVRPELTLSEAKVAASLLMTLPGTPILYYGQEIGMPNGSGTADEHKRTPMRWTTEGRAGFSTYFPWQIFSTREPQVSVQAQQDTPGSLLRHYQQMIQLRNQHPALQTGGHLSLVSPAGTLSFIRFLPNQVLLVSINLTEQGQQIQLALSGTPYQNSQGSGVLNGLNVSAGRVSGMLEGHGVSVVSLLEP
ncbi:alpha-amylase family glycosyl hydrolase [Deinococcus roseus]|uniref:Alpha-amylase n=1 Tax=Deinococcus roseus TaxID=392414 RepID=A0ABQ2CWE7_9DEIO|nr:alpha-amylase family glycosyl hydrolase [Deinococcus roseus]GGJ27226.1 alpha-amylase [Deinococcus roseus]